MPVKVEICTKVLTACWAHALSTEVEEVMGILMGDMDTQEELLRLSCLIPIRRTTKQKDRVEIDGNDLVTASMEAEKLGLRVLGWYHSHPHITVHPSHVDLRTQLNYQAMDKNFVGLIFSVFNYDVKNGQDNREVVVFQTDDVQDCDPQCRYLHLVPVISNHPEDSMISKFVHRSVSSVSRILMEEELAEEQVASGGDDVGIGHKLHNSALLATRLVQQAGVVTEPVLDSVRLQIGLTKERIAALKIRRERLIKEIGEKDA